MPLVLLLELVCDASSATAGVSLPLVLLLDSVSLPLVLLLEC